MKRLFLAAAISAAAAFGAYAQTADKDPQGAAESVQKPSGDYEHPPTGRMDEATPTLKSGEKGQHPPAGRMDTATPPMKPDDPAKKGTSTTEIPSDQGSASTGASSGEQGAAGPASQNLFTSDEARRHLMHLGYTNVSALEKDADGKWVGTAIKDGKSFTVAVDIKGAVLHK